jgi:hypothetical protein
MRIAVTGLPFFGKRVVGALRRAGVESRYVPRMKEAIAEPRRLLFLARADLVYAIGPGIQRNGPMDVVRRTRKPMVIHWVGSDVLHGLRTHEQGRASATLLGHAEHWADAAWLIEELGPLGIAVIERPLPMPIAIGEATPMPAEHRVLVFLPANPHAAYDLEGTLEVISSLPEVAFTMVGGYVPAQRYDNLHNMGFVRDMASVYREHSIYMRLSHHDGLAHSVVEALSFGRQVVWTHALGGVTRAAGKMEAIAALQSLVAVPPRLNEAGLATAERYREARTVGEALEQFQRIVEQR